MPAPSALARMPNLTEPDLKRLLLRDIGMSPAWLRLIVRARPAVSAVWTTDEHVAQVAYAIGYRHPSQMHRDLRRLLRASPRSLREQR